MSETEEKNISFLQLAVLFKMKKEEREKTFRKVIISQQEEKETFSNLIQEMKPVDRECAIYC